MSGKKKVNTYIGKMSKSERVAFFSNLVLMLLLVVSFIYALFNCFVAPISSSTENTKSNYMLTAWQSLLGIIVLSLPSVLKKFRLVVPAYLKIVLVFYVLAAIFLGEVRHYYYRFEHWDTLCHMCSGMIFTVLSFSFVYLLNAGKGLHDKMSPGFVALFAFCFAATSGLVWEVMEFCIDTIVGCNMQKFIPMVDGLFNGGAGREPLLGTDEQIAAFFRRPEGYKYALMDTMYDLVVDLVGAFIMTMVCYALMKAKKARMDEFVITRVKETETVKEIVIQTVVTEVGKQTAVAEQEKQPTVVADELCETAEQEAEVEQEVASTAETVE